MRKLPPKIGIRIIVIHIFVFFLHRHNFLPNFHTQKKQQKTSYCLVLLGYGERASKIIPITYLHSGKQHKEISRHCRGRQRGRVKRERTRSGCPTTPSPRPPSCLSSGHFGSFWWSQRYDWSEEHTVVTSVTILVGVLSLPMGTLAIFEC